MHPICTVHQNIAVGMKFGIFTAIELVAMHPVEKGTSKTISNCSAHMKAIKDKETNEHIPVLIIITHKNN